MDLSTEACIHFGGRTYPKNSLLNAICDVIEDPPPARATALVDCNGRSYQGYEIDEIARSPEFAAHKAALRALGKTRD